MIRTMTTLAMIALAGAAALPTVPCEARGPLDPSPSGPGPVGPGPIGTQQITLVAVLAGPTAGQEGVANYREQKVAGGRYQWLDVKITGAAPGEPIAITAKGVRVGTVTPDASGKAELHLAVRTPTGGISPIPQLRRGDGMVAGSLAGTLQ